MGAVGTVLAIEITDNALISDDLMHIAEALRISKLTLKNIHQNALFALMIVALWLADVFMGSAHMAIGVKTLE